MGVITNDIPVVSDATGTVILMYFMALNLLSIIALLFWLNPFMAGIVMAIVPFIAFVISHGSRSVAHG
eukprot:2480524-Pyramimonas_sp.AAC.1